MSSRVGNCTLRWNFDARGYTTHMQMALFSPLIFLLFGQLMKYIPKMFSECTIYLSLPSFGDRNNMILAIPFPVIKLWKFIISDLP